MTADLEPPLAGLRREIDDVIRAAHRIAEASGKHWGTRPAPGRWSVAECVDHLNATAGQYAPSIRAGIAEARLSGRRPRSRYRRDLAGWFLSWSLEPPARMRFKTTEPFVPKAVRPRDVVLAEFDRRHNELSDLLDEVATIDATGVKVPSSFNPKLKYTIDSAYRILTAHARRHLWQAERVVAALSSSDAQR